MCVYICTVIYLSLLLSLGWLLLQLHDWVIASAVCLMLGMLFSVQFSLLAAIQYIFVVKCFFTD